jgi:hypothetical protein
LWWMLLGGALVLVAGICTLTSVSPMAGSRVAVLRATTADASLVIVVVEPHKGLTMCVVGPASIPAGMALGKNLAPYPVGLVSAEIRHVATALRSNTTLAVSMEPVGGSPSGLPSSAVLYGGALNTTWIDPPPISSLLW